MAGSTGLPPPAMRIKSHWFGQAAGKSHAEQASAMAFIVWRVAHQMLKRMRHAGFDIDIGRPYFDFLSEVLVFLAAVTDRSVHARLPPEARVAFTTALVRHLARILDENEREFLGQPAPGHGAADDRFLAQFNELAPHYAEFGADPQAGTPADGFHPDFGFIRYLGHRLEDTLPPKDRRWVIDQVQAIEVPEALGIVQHALRDLYDPAPRTRRRASMNGE